MSFDMQDHATPKKPSGLIAPSGVPSSDDSTPTVSTQTDCNPMGRIPAEIKATVFCALTDARSAHNLALASRTMYAVYRANRRNITYHVADNMVCKALGFTSPYILKLLIMEHEARYRVHDQKGFDEFIAKFAKPGPVAHGCVTDSTLAMLPRLLYHVNYFLTFSRAVAACPFRDGQYLFTGTELARATRILLAVETGLCLCVLCLKTDRVPFEKLKSYWALFSPTEALQVCELFLILYMHPAWKDNKFISWCKAKFLLNSNPFVVSILSVHDFAKGPRNGISFAPDAEGALAEAWNTLVAQMETSFQPRFIYTTNLGLALIIMDLDRYHRLLKDGPAWERAAWEDPASGSGDGSDARVPKGFLCHDDRLLEHMLPRIDLGVAVASYTQFHNVTAFLDRLAGNRPAQLRTLTLH